VWDDDDDGDGDDDDDGAGCDDGGDDDDGAAAARRAVWCGARAGERARDVCDGGRRGEGERGGGEGERGGERGGKFGIETAGCGGEGCVGVVGSAVAEREREETRGEDEIVAHADGGRGGESRHQG
jgi:hypothetical protein